MARRSKAHSLISRWRGCETLRRSTFTSLNLTRRSHSVWENLLFHRLYRGLPMRSSPQPARESGVYRLGRSFSGQLVSPIVVAVVVPTTELPVQAVGTTASTTRADRGSDALAQQQLVRRDREVADPLAGGVKYCVGHGGSHARDSNLAHAAGADRIEVEIRLADKLHIDFGNVGVRRNMIIGEVARSRQAGFGVVSGFFH